MSILVNPEKPNLDIVLVHGLNVWNNPTHADDTWTSGPPGDGVHWLRDFLPLHEETSRARVLAHTYNASAVFGAAITGVVAQAENLLGWLWLERRGCTSRPLIFIAHSLGGLIVKEALVQARQGGGRFASIWFFTNGIMFFGTPHRGVNTTMYSVLANILRAISSDPDPGFLSSLEQYSGEAERLHERFSIVQGYYQFVSVYETRPHRIKSLGVIVPRLSALLGLSDDREIRIPLDRNHNQICKFSHKNEPDFQLIFPHVVNLCKKAIASFKHPTNFSVREQHIAHLHSPINDGQLSIKEAIKRARNLLESRQTMVAMNDVDEEIHAHHATSNSLAISSLIPLATGLSIILVTLRLILFWWGHLVPTIQSMAGRITGGLEDIETEQGHVFNLSRLSIQLLDDRLQAILMARQSLDAHLTAVPIDLENETEAKNLLARLDIHSEELVRELLRRHPAVDDAHRRVRETEDFREELRRASETADESWLEWLLLLVPRPLRWLYSLVAEIGRFIAEQVSSAMT